MKAIYMIAVLALAASFSIAHAEDPEVRYNRLSKTNAHADLLQQFAFLVAGHKECRGEMSPTYKRKLVKRHTFTTESVGVEHYDEYIYYVQTSDCACEIFDGVGTRYDSTCEHE
jgi:hypothetical protein